MSTVIHAYILTAISVTFPLVISIALKLSRWENENGFIRKERRTTRNR